MDDIDVLAVSLLSSSVTQGAGLGVSPVHKQ